VALTAVIGNRPAGNQKGRSHGADRSNLFAGLLGYFCRTRKLGLGLGLWSTATARFTSNCPQPRDSATGRAVRLRLTTLFGLDW